MKPICFLLSACIFFACKNDKKTTTDDSSVKQVALSRPFEPFELEVYIDDFKIRNGPGIEHKEVARLKENTLVMYLGEKSRNTTEIKLRGVKLNTNWLKVKTKEGIEGWIYGGGIRAPKNGKEITKRTADFIPFVNFVDKKLGHDINMYRLEWNSARTSSAFADAYLSGEEAQQKFNETLASKVQIDNTDKLIDMSWIDFFLPGFQNSLVAEGTTFNIFKDFKVMYAKAKETEGTEDDNFITFQFHANELDSVEYYYKSWFMQTWDYGGHSLLGQGKHFDLLNEANELLAKSSLFEKPILNIKNEILNDISAEHITYWESKDKILAEMKKIIDADFHFLAAVDKILIKTRYEQFKKPAANKIEVNNRAF